MGELADGGGPLAEWVEAPPGAFKRSYAYNYFDGQVALMMISVTDDDHDLLMDHVRLTYYVYYAEVGLWQLRCDLRLLRSDELSQWVQRLWRFDTARHNGEEGELTEADHRAFDDLVLTSAMEEQL